MKILYVLTLTALKLHILVSFLCLSKSKKCRTCVLHKFLERNSAIVPIQGEEQHVIFYNSLTLRLPSVKRPLSAIVPRSVYNRIAVKLEGARLGAVCTEGHRYYKFKRVKNEIKVFFFHSKVQIQSKFHILRLSS